MHAALKHPTAWAPLLMSGAALSLVVGYVAMYGVVREPDEGTPAHLFQLLMAAQLPIIAVFAVMWLPKAPKQTVMVVALQVMAILAALAPVFFLEL